MIDTWVVRAATIRRVCACPRPPVRLGVVAYGAMDLSNRLFFVQLPAEILPQNIGTAVRPAVTLTWAWLPGTRARRLPSPGELG